MRILAIETSCDDTCVAVLEIKNWKLEILSNIVSSQVKIHAKYGGVYPTLAKREHQKNLPITLARALYLATRAAAKSKSALHSFPPLSRKRDSVAEEEDLSSLTKLSTKQPKIDAVAVTVGPGLEPCLWVGVNFAKALSYIWKKPIIPINHIEAHIFANFVDSNSKFKLQNAKLQSKIKNLFPAVCLVVSGGHTQLILMRGHRKYKILGETRDDAAGECFDKIARILGLGYPGGPAIAAEATKIQNPKSEILNKSQILNSKSKIKLPRPMIYQKNYDFSFSGLKTAVLYNFKSQPERIRKSKKYIQAMCAEAQQAIIDVLIKKTIQAAEDYNAKTIILGGGVAANKELRKQFREKIKKELPKTKYLIPDTKFCTDNAAMIAVAGYFNRQKKRSWKKIKANANLKIGKKA